MMKSSKSLTIVIKLGVLVSVHLALLESSYSSGTSSIVDEKTHEPILSILTLIVETAVKLRKHGHRVVLVSSGAIGVGLRRMDIEKRPKHLPQVQVCLFGLLDGLWHLTFSGTGSNRSMPSYLPLGFSLCSSPTTRRANSLNEK